MIRNETIEAVPKAIEGFRGSVLALAALAVKREDFEVEAISEREAELIVALWWGQSCNEDPGAAGVALAMLESDIATLGNEFPEGPAHLFCDQVAKVMTLLAEVARKKGYAGSQPEELETFRE